MYQVDLQNEKYLKSGQRKRLKKIFFWIIFLLAILLTLKSFLKPREIIVKHIEKVIPEEQEKISKPISYTISDGDIPADIFKKYGKFNANHVALILDATKDVYDFTNIRIGKNLRFYFGEKAYAQKMEYDYNNEKMIVVEREGDTFKAREEIIKYEISEGIARGSINNFFYADALKAGLSERSVLQVSDIFAFDVDFMTDIRVGDEFVVIYEKRKRGDEGAPDGKILAAKFVNQGKVSYAYYFNTGDGGGYYDGEGRALERQFLKAPLSYRRISSGFTGARYHPITKTVSAHYQIDYAAPTGTAVVASAKGSIVSAGWEGGWGKMIRLRHDNGYTTHYGHLSSFAKGVRSGTKVRQGQIIGFVGSTGWSTGPHLDYGMKLNGSPVNPLKLDLPKGKPLGDEYKNSFTEVKNKYLKTLN